MSSFLQLLQNNIRWKILDKQFIYEHLLSTCHSNLNERIPHQVEMFHEEIDGNKGIYCFDEILNIK